jgi:hypothetical protein
MDRRWKDTMAKGTIRGMHLLMGWLCMLVVAERLMDNEIIIIFVLCFGVLFKYTLHLLKFEGA